MNYLLAWDSVKSIHEDKQSPGHTVVYLYRTVPGQPKWFCSCGEGKVPWPNGIKGQGRFT